MTKLGRIALFVVGVAIVAALLLYLRARTSHEPDGGAASAERASTRGGAQAAAADRVTAASVATVEKRDVPIVVEGLGTVTSLATVTVKSQVDGRLDRVLFKEGDTVKKGDVLAQIDPRPYLIQLHQAEAALVRDEAQLKNGQLNLDRNEALRTGQLVAQKDVDDQRALVAQLDGAVRTDRAQVENAKLMLDYARITSPIDGVTGVRLVDSGNLVRSTDAGGIVVVTQLDPIAVLFTLPQDDLPRIQRAMKGRKLQVEAYARDGVQKLGEGELGLVDNQVNAQTATIRLKAVLPNAEHALWPNAFVKARLRLDTLQGALVVPAAVVQRGPQGTFGYVVGQDDVVAVRPLVARIQGDLAVIESGAEAGETFVSDGQNQLKPGAKIAPRRSSKGTP